MIPEAVDHLGYMLMGADKHGELQQQLTQGIWAPSKYEATPEYWEWLNNSIPRAYLTEVGESLRLSAPKGCGKGKPSTKRARSDGPSWGRQRLGPSQQRIATCHVGRRPQPAGPSVPHDAI